MSSKATYRDLAVSDDKFRMADGPEVL